MTTMSGWKRRACSIASATRAGLGDDLEVLAPVEQRDEALADDLVVVDDEQAQGTRVSRQSRSALSGGGSVGTLLDVPASGSGPARGR